MSGSVLPKYLDRLNNERKRLEAVSMSALFEADSDRFENFSTKTGSVLFDYSKNRIDAASFELLLELATQAGVAEKRDAMFSGAEINETEERAVLHIALRNRSNSPIMVDGQNVMKEVNDVLDRMGIFSEAVRSGEYQVTGGKITDIVNIGIGGSDLGPRMVVQALTPYHDGPRTHFVANVDGADISDTLAKLDPKTTLFIVASKTFTTQETMTNAHSALEWVRDAVGDSAANHFCALSTNLEATRSLGIPDERTFGFWDWVGGRYSVWSAIGLSVMIAIGKQDFDEFLEGAHAADQHFSASPFQENIPVLMALLGVWYRNIWDMPTQAVLPYDDRMARFTAWLQQLDMESNGKSVSMSGDNLGYATGPIVFGEPGTNGQHAFYQLIHQGTTIVPCDFLVAEKPSKSDRFGIEHHRLLLANCFAQSEALMAGRSLQEASGNAHKLFTGNRPSNTFLYERLDPHTLGMLMAFYEHKIFVQGVIWGINSFDQWGVELGKQLAKQIEPMLASGDFDKAQNASTKGLLKAVGKI